MAEESESTRTAETSRVTSSGSGVSEVKDAPTITATSFFITTVAGSTRDDDASTLTSSSQSAPSPKPHRHKRLRSQIKNRDVHPQSSTDVSDLELGAASKEQKAKKREKAAEEKKVDEETPESPPHPLDHRDGDKDPDDDEIQLRFGARHITLLFVPVTITMLLSLTVHEIIHMEQNLVQKYSRPQQGLLTPFGEGESSIFGAMTTGSKAGDAVVDALIFLAFIVLMTCGITLLYVFRFYKTMGVLLGGMMSFSVYVMTGNLMIGRVFRALNLTMWNWPIMALWGVNFGVGGPLAMFWKAPPRVTQGTICLGTAIVAVTLTIMLPKWPCWIILGFLALWDIFAVCAPCGPLRIMVTKAQERQHEEHEFGKGMLYETMVWLMADVPAGGKEAAALGKADLPLSSAEDSQSALTETEATSAKLGLGDFVFYSILIVKCGVLGREVEDDPTADVDWPSTICALVSILVGLCATLVYLSIRQKPLPALPISILTGLAVSFGSYFAVRPFNHLICLDQSFP